MTASLAADRIYDLSGEQLNVQQLKLGSTVVLGADLTSAFTGTDVDLGSSGVAGSLDIFPTTASKGKLTFTATDSTGNTTTAITNAAQSAAATLTIPDTNGSASFVMTAATQTIGGAKTFSTTPVLGAGTTIDLPGTTATLSSNAVTITEYFATITTEDLTTAAGASQAFVITKVGTVAGDLAFVQDVGGTNTRFTYQYKAVCTTDTITVTVYNSGPTNALNGNLKFNLMVLHK